MDIDWKAIFLPDTPLLEIILRGSLMYLALFLLLRVILKRQAGALGMTDLLLITLLADASQNGMAGDYKSLPDGVALVVTISFWDYALNWLSYRFSFLRRLIEHPPLPLIKNGQLVRNNMPKELISKADLMSQLREQGVSHITNVKHAYIESDGQISVIKYEEENDKMRKDGPS